MRAFLDMIAYAEGAGYSTLFGGGTFAGFDDHPRTTAPAPAAPAAPPPGPR